MTSPVSGVWGSLVLFWGRNWTALKSRKLISRISLAISFRSRIFLTFLFSLKIHNENYLGIAFVHVRSVNLLAYQKSELWSYNLIYDRSYLWKFWWLFVMPGTLIFLFYWSIKTSICCVKLWLTKKYTFSSYFKKASPALLDLRSKSSFIGP